MAGDVDGGGFGDFDWHGVISGLKAEKAKTFFWHGFHGWTRLLPIISSEIGYSISEDRLPPEAFCK